MVKIMNKKKYLIIFGIAIIIIAVVLTTSCWKLFTPLDGVANGEANGDSGEVEVIEYSVMTIWSTGVSPDFENHEESGLYHDNPEDAYEMVLVEDKRSDVQNRRRPYPRRYRQRLKRASNTRSSLLMMM